MKFRVKAALFALSTGLIALQSFGCFARWLGDLVGDTIAFRNID